MDVRGSILLFTWVLLWSADQGYAQDPVDRWPVRLGGTAAKHVEFQIGPGERFVENLHLISPGRIKLQVMWSGAAEQLALAVNRPGQLGDYAHKDGSSPMAAEFVVTDRLFRRGNRWRASVVNSSNGYAKGWLLVEYPGSRRPPRRVVEVDRMPGDVLDEHDVARADTSSPQAETESGSGNGIRTILDDGTVVTEYPDGRIKRQKIGDCGYSIEFPDGREQFIMCAEVQVEDIPDLPSSLLAREDLGLALSRLNANLLGLMRGVVDEQSVQRYLELERGMSLLGTINLRFQALHQLIQ